MREGAGRALGRGAAGAPGKRVLGETRAEIREFSVWMCKLKGADSENEGRAGPEENAGGDVCRFGAYYRQGEPHASAHRA
ncbi:hypothetical protein A0H81_14139 [Grifola frondosa]|uniref:Uncharacterized protein n=1 Tax=Grifola frondosa TaxID=5627 RepID=A0A1C7LM53_GRIFR|nr:hypothetical protein A0H81_14139 [Grifola frondosa]